MALVQTSKEAVKPRILQCKGVVLNRKNLGPVLNLKNEQCDAEYLYLRENELTNFKPIRKMEYLRVLDLSINDIANRVSFVHLVPNLRHLYLTGNKIESLDGLSNLTALESLCLSDNVIDSFDGLKDLPNLRVLSLNFNNISSFANFPRLPALHSLNLYGNPVAEVPSFRSMAISVNNPDLVSINGNAIQAEERAAAEYLRGKIAFCIRNGFIVEGDDVEEMANEFLLRLERQGTDEHPLQLNAIRLQSEVENGPTVVMENIPVKLSLCLQDVRSHEQCNTDGFYAQHLYPVIFKLSGEATEVFVVGSMNHWTDPIKMERCVDGEEVYFETTLYLPAGDYEYRYIVDGAEKISESNQITSKKTKGFCNLYHVNEFAAFSEDRDNIIHIRWMRSNTFGVFDVVDGQTSLEYIPKIDDINCCLRAEVLVYVNGNFGFLYYDITSPVLPAPPTCPRLEIKGSIVEGGVLMAEADYIGGVEGDSSLSWYRIAPSGDEFAVERVDPWAGYKLTKADVGCRIRVVFTPVRDDWVAGEAKVATTETILPGPPECQLIKIIGTLMEGSQLEVNVIYTGGTEGASVYQWLRGVDGTDMYIPIEGETFTKYIPTAEDVGKCLAVEYTPINVEGREGETCRCVLENPIEPAAPEIRHLAITGVLQPTHALTLEYEYAGGQSGQHIIQWYRREGNDSVKIGEVNEEFLTLTESEVDHFVEVSITPVRLDGVRGKTVHAKTYEVIMCIPPQEQQQQQQEQEQQERCINETQKDEEAIEAKEESEHKSMFDKIKEEIEEIANEQSEDKDKTKEQEAVAEEKKEEEEEEEKQREEEKEEEQKEECEIEKIEEEILHEDEEPHEELHEEKKEEEEEEEAEAVKEDAVIENIDPVELNTPSAENKPSEEMQHKAEECANDVKSNEENPASAPVAQEL